MTFDATLAEIRFGCGLSPHIAPPGSVQEMLDRLAGPDRAAETWPIDPPGILMQRMQAYIDLQRERKRAGKGAKQVELGEQMKKMRLEARARQSVWFGQALLRRAGTGDGFRERLAFFWADHFTALGKSGTMKNGTAPYVEGAIRPHLTGRFADMLRAVVSAPLMLDYLDQASSMGPDSEVAQGGKRKNSGLNENLARELMELHTLGVGGPYGQDDVRQMAELLTGLSYRPGEGFLFRSDFAEPGVERVLGRDYGGAEPARLEEVMEVIEDLAVHPATAAHLAHKLAVHFTGDTPEPDLVQALTDSYAETGGDLARLYAVLLEHPASWEGPGNVKQPADFIGSALRALAVSKLPSKRENQMRLLFVQPIEMMGQPWEAPEGPDGWPEADGDWITPQRLAGRLQWALTAPSVLAPDLPDPRDFLEAALGDRAPEALVFAAGAAEGRREGVALVLASPAFQRM